MIWPLWQCFATTCHFVINGNRSTYRVREFNVNKLVKSSIALNGTAYFKSWTHSYVVRNVYKVYVSVLIQSRSYYIYRSYYALNFFNVLHHFFVTDLLGCMQFPPSTCRSTARSSSSDLTKSKEPLFFPHSESGRCSHGNKYKYQDQKLL